MRTCSKCHQSKRARCFHKDSAATGKRSPWCIKCRKEYMKMRYQEKKKSTSSKECVGCGETQSIRMFRSIIGTGRSDLCNDCYVPSDPWPELTKHVPHMDFSNRVYR